MTLRDIIHELGLKVCCGEAHLDREVTGGYASDLMSDVMANSQAGDIWVTLQGHENSVAVAMLRDLSGIILVGDRQPDAEMIKRAEEEGIPILISSDHTFAVVSAISSLPPFQEMRISSRANEQTSERVNDQ